MPELGASGSDEKATFDAALKKAAKLIAHCMPEGLLVNGQISATIAGTTLQVAIKTASGANPSTSNPVWCRIGTRIVTLTAPLSLTRTSDPLVGYSTNSWLNLANGPVTGTEVDLFTYIGWSTSLSTPFLAVSREGWHTKFGFQAETSGHGALCSLATGPGGSFPYMSMDPIAVCGRFAATLTTQNTWSTPASGSFIVQGPIDRTRMLKFNANWWVDHQYYPYGYGSTLTNISDGPTQTCYYQYDGPWLRMSICSMLHYTAPSTRSNVLILQTPISPQDYTVWGYYPFGNVKTWTAATPNGYYKDMTVNPVATSVFLFFRADRASFTSPCTMLVSGKLSSYMPGQRRSINW